VQARLGLWLKTHVEKLLGPLTALAKAEDITGIARGVAFQIVEALGVLDRAGVADDVKSLDQTARGTLRKHGVRFGAYHVFLPVLLKPAPRALGLMLWALRHGGLSQKGVDELPGIAASGRTSIAVDKEIAKPLYRLVGYRVCDTRAVRVDILERLADLIRPALSWRPGMPGDKPTGAVDGRSFTVTVAMTSLVGCSGEDFASILRALGYRMELRLPPSEPAAPAPTEPHAVETAPAAELESADPATSEAPAESAPDSTIEAASAATPAEPAAAPEIATPAEPAMIEVWRPGRPAGARHRRPREHERRRKPEAVSKPEQTQHTETAAPKPPEVREPRRQGRHDRQRRPFRPDRPGGMPREERPRERAIDPNSPFAALAELKARLEAEGKNKG
jgi:ATP-dependent RNA helicase SUPV3L1/SUV3